VYYHCENAIDYHCENAMDNEGLVGFGAIYDGKNSISS
jgi:hypothetical protein